MTEEELIKALKKSDTAAFEELIRRYIRYVSSIVFRIAGGCSADCEEITYDVFLAAWNGRDRLPTGKLKGWLGAVARNKAFDLLRSRQDTLPLEDTMIELDTGGVEEAAERRDNAAMVEKALMQLDKPQRELFVRHYYYGQTVREAAEEMQINVSTAKTWLARGRETLKEILEKEGYTI